MASCQTTRCQALLERPPPKPGGKADETHGDANQEQVGPEIGHGDRAAGGHDGAAAGTGSLLLRLAGSLPVGLGFVDQDLALALDRERSRRLAGFAPLVLSDAGPGEPVVIVLYEQYVTNQ